MWSPTTGSRGSIKPPASALLVLKRTPRGLRVHPQAHMVIAIGLEFEAIHDAAHRSAAIDEVQSPGDVNPSEGRPELALANRKRELQEGNLHPVIGSHRQ